MWLSPWGLSETGPDADHRYNTHVLVDSDGDVRASYKEDPLFDVDIPNGPVLMESKTASPGDAIVAADSPDRAAWHDGVLRPAIPRAVLAAEARDGRTYHAVPSAFTKPTGEAHWEVLLRARAIETQSYVIAAAQAGVHSEKRESYGHAIIIDPWGRGFGQTRGSGQRHRHSDRGHRSRTTWRM